ncbi:MAG: hypothetical protein GY871_18090 [Actinomycetales bacterium]|nr:hypothetical protein [Actinomycetales bacterium]
MLLVLLGLACSGRGSDSGGCGFFADVDADGYGAPGLFDCSDGVADATDCDDRDASVHPGAEEVPYDGVDQDCNGADLDDVDGDGSPGDIDCDDEDAQRSPDLHEVCDDHIDNDCDDEVDDDCQYFGGVAPADAAAVIYGESETVACCGSSAGFFLDGGDLDGDGNTDLILYSVSGGTEFKVMAGPLEGTLTTTDRLAELNSLAAQPYPETYDRATLSTGDVTGDSVIDLILAEPAESTIGIYAGPIAGWYSDDDQSAIIQGGAWDVLGSDVAVGIGPAPMLSFTHERVYEAHEVVIMDVGSDDGVDCASNAGVRDTRPGSRLSRFLTVDLEGDGEERLAALSADPWSEAGPESAFLSFHEYSESNCLSADDADSTLVIEDGVSFDAVRAYDSVSLGRADFDGDGRDDLSVVGAGRDEFGGNAEWIATLVAAGEGEPLPIARVSRTAGHTQRIAATVAGDMDGDGTSELVISATDNASSGDVYVFFGPLTGTYVLEEDAFGILQGSIAPFASCETEGCQHPGSLFGWTLLGGSDFTGDGHPDLAVGAPGFEFDTSSNDKGPGAVYVFSGR